MKICSKQFSNMYICVQYLEKYLQRHMQKCALLHIFQIFYINVYVHCTQGKVVVLKGEGHSSAGLA